MTAMQKRRTGTVTADLKAFQSIAMGPIAPPATVHLGPGVRPIWDFIIAMRARDEWSFVDLHCAAHLARSMAAIERLSTELSGDVQPNDVRHSLIDRLSQRAVRLTRFLHLHASALNGRPRDALKARQAEQRARDTIQDAGTEDDGLLATPPLPGRSRDH